MAMEASLYIARKGGKKKGGKEKRREEKGREGKGGKQKRREGKEAGRKRSSVICRDCLGNYSECSGTMHHIKV